jgi:lysophospholipase L1-like esterase
MLKNKRLSILGDSISTYIGVSNNSIINPTIGDNPVFYRPPFPRERTYWEIVLDTFGLTLSVNNSWSGGNLSGKDDPTSGVNRAGQLTNAEGKEPDLIILFMGINDLGRGVDPEVFSDDYRLTLDTLSKQYPKAKVCCVNIPDREPYFKKRAEVFNKAIEEAVRLQGENYFIADLFGSRLNNDFYYNNTLDGLHPDEDGMRIIAEVVIKAIEENI